MVIEKTRQLVSNANMMVVKMAVVKGCVASASLVGREKR
jgi:hypothetical protein